MTLHAVLVSMITVTTTAAGVLGIIKRRCGASKSIKDLVSKCVQLVEKIRELLKTMEDGTQVPHNTNRISTALNQRREEFDSVLKSLEKIKQRTERTHPADRTENFIMAQGWCKKMETVLTDLVHVKNGVENIAAIWDVADIVMTKFEEMEAIDITKKKESGRQTRRNGRNVDYNTMGSISLNLVNVDRMLMIMVKLTDAAKSALNQHGDLENLSIPDAMFTASEHASEVTTYIQLLQGAAELLHPDAHANLGDCYYYGWNGLEESIDLAVHHYSVASSRGNIRSMLGLMEHYNDENDKKHTLKYIEMVSNSPEYCFVWEHCMQFAIDNNCGGAQLTQRLIDSNTYISALQQSIRYFFGVGVQKCNQKAIDAFPTFDSDSYSVKIDDDEKDFCNISRPFCSFGWYGLSRTAKRNYADFLFQSNQILPWLNFSYCSGIYSIQKWKRYAFQAANSQCLDAHVFLAFHFSRGKYQNKHEVKRHLRIAADGGHSRAQHACREMFGIRLNFPKSVRLVEECQSGNRKKESRKHREKRCEERKSGSREKKNASVSKKRSAAKT